MPKGYHHVTRDLRCQIYALKAMGLSLRTIACKLSVAASTISREIRRNTGQRGYRYSQADSKAEARRGKASRVPKKMTEALKKEISERLQEDWSPEQIAGRFKQEGKVVSYETIYRYVWQDKRNGGALYQHLRHHGKRYNKRGSGKAGRGCIPNRIDITERPATVENKLRIGDWEGDTIIGAQHKGAILSYADRHSKFTLLKKMMRKTANNVHTATVEKMRALPHKVLTITYDNGKEFSDHEKIAADLNASCYFATPYHSWERGLNEHTNGLVRQYLPKSSTFDTVTDEKIQWIENRLNNRPRKVLQYRTPFEVFYENTTTTNVLRFSVEWALF